MKGLETSITFKSGENEIATTWTYEWIHGRKVLKTVDIHHPKPVPVAKKSN